MMRPDQPEARLDPWEIAAELSKRGLDWADKNAAFKALEDTTKTVLSICTSKLNDPDLSATAAEVIARRATGYQEHLKALADARLESNRATVNYDVYKVYIEMRRSLEATNRAEMTMR
jgi:hypothetical protein